METTIGHALIFIFSYDITPQITKNQLHALNSGKETK